MASLVRWSSRVMLAAGISTLGACGGSVDGPGEGVDASDAHVGLDASDAREGFDANLLCSIDGFETAACCMHLGGTPASGPDDLCPIGFGIACSADGTGHPPHCCFAPPVPTCGPRVAGHLDGGVD